MSLKVGDRVVVDSLNEPEYSISRNGWVGTIKTSGDEYCMVVFDLHNMSLYVKSKHLQYEFVYNSPLYKALK